MSWSEKYKKSINCDNPKGFSQRAHCQGRKKKMNENKSGDSSLHDWFSKSRSSDGKPGWVQLGGKYAGKPCAKQPGQTTKPKCGSSKMKRNLNKDEEEAAFRRKNREDPNPNRKGKAKNVATEEMNLDEKCWKGYTQKGMKKKGNRVVPNCVPVGEAVSEKDDEYSMIRSQLKGIHNAASRLDKKVGKNKKGGMEAWVQSKITKAADYIDTAADYVTNEEKNVHGDIEIPSGNGGKLKKLASRAAKRIDTDVDGDVEHNDKHKGEYGEFVPTGGDPRKAQGRQFTSMKVKSVKEAVGDLDEGIGLKIARTIDKTKPPVGRPSKRRAVSTALKMREVIKSTEKNKDRKFSGKAAVEESAAWTRKAGKNKEGGLNEKGRKSYERENPGSDLKAPSKKVGNPRRKSFCARMSGMKKKLTSSKTANDPNSRINKSLRAWNC